MASKKRKPGRGATATATEPPVRSINGWTVARIELAKRMADSGDLSLAADLCERIFGDERALGPLQAVAGISGIPLKFETALRDTESSDDPLVEALEEDWWKIYPEDLQGEMLRWGAVLGVALTHTAAWDADPETGRILPTLDVWHPRALLQDPETSQWKVRTKENVSGVEIEPGDSEWQLLTVYGRKRPWTKAPWYGLGLLWFAAQCAKIDWAGWNDSHAQPIRSGENEKAETHGLLDEAAQKDLAKKIASLVRGGALVMPDGYALKLVEASSKNWESFVKLCHEVWPMAVAIALTGHNLTTQIEGGSFAAAKEATGVSQERKRTLARCFETTSREQCLTWWAEFNFASAAPPWPKYQIDPPKDLTAAADRFQKGTAALVSLSNSGWEIDDDQEDQLAELIGIRVRRVEKAPDDEQTPPGAPGAKAPPKPPAAKPAPKALAHQHERSTAAATEPDGLERGQVFVDAVVEQGIAAGAEALGPDLATLTRMISEAKDLRSLREHLFAAYAEMEPAAFLAILERAEVLAAMAGRWSAAADV